MRSKVQHEVSQFIVENFLFGEAMDGLKPDTSLLGAGVIDSTGVLELVQFLETRFEIRFEDREIVPQNLDTIANIGCFVSQKLGEIA